METNEVNDTDSLEETGGEASEQTVAGNTVYVTNDGLYLTQIQQMMEMMVIENKRRDEMFERVLGKISPHSSSRDQTIIPENSFHVMPDMSKVIGFFDGDRDIPKAEEWIQNIETSATLNRWPENYQLETARAHLKGPAIYWYKTKQAGIHTWSDFRREFFSSYKPAVKLADKWDKMRARKQQRNESVISYFYEKLNLCQKLNLEISDIVQEILSGLSSKDIAATLVSKQYSNYDTLLHRHNYLRKNKISRVQ